VGLIAQMASMMQIRIRDLRSDSDLLILNVTFWMKVRISSVMLIYRFLMSVVVTVRAGRHILSFNFFITYVLFQ